MGEFIQISKTQPPQEWYTKKELRLDPKIKYRFIKDLTYNPDNDAQMLIILLFNG